MTVFRYEFQQYRRSILGWTVVLALCIFVMTPLYYGFLDMAGTESTLFETLGQSDFFKSMGMSVQFLSQPLGMYSFLTSFFMIAAGIFGLYSGISIHTKEYAGGTAEYLFTKPCPRKTVFWAKAAVVCCGDLLVGAAYAAASFLAMGLFRPGFSTRELFLISLSLVILTCFFSAAGLLIGVVFPQTRSPLLTAGLLVFVTYCIASFSRVIGIRAIGYLSPFSCFAAGQISETGFYQWDYLICCLVWMVLLIVAARRWFLMADIRFPS